MALKGLTCWLNVFHCWWYAAHLHDVITSTDWLLRSNGLNLSVPSRVQRTVGCVRSQLSFPLPWSVCQGVRMSCTYRGPRTSLASTDVQWHPRVLQAWISRKWLSRLLRQSALEKNTCMDQIYTWTSWQVSTLFKWRGLLRTHIKQFWEC